MVSTSHRSYNGSPPTCRDLKRTSSKSRTGPLPTRSSSGSTGIVEPRRTALSIRPAVCSPHKQVGKHANKVNATFPMFPEASPAEKVPLHDWNVLWFRIPFEAWQWKTEALSPKWETLSKARFWTAMGNTHPKHGSSMDLGRLRARLASPLTEVQSTESGKVDVVNIEVTGKVVKMLCSPYKHPQDPLKLLEALDTDMITLNANLADGADPVSPVEMAKLIDNPETVLVIYGEVETVWDALQTVLKTPGIAENDYLNEKVQVCYWLPGAGKTGKGGIQVKALVVLAVVKIKKKVCTTLLDCEASQCLCHLATPHYRSTIHRFGSPRT